MKFLNKILILCAVAVAMVGCEDYIGGDLNADPNNPTSVPVSAQMPSIQLNLVDAYGGSFSRFNCMLVQQVEGVARQWSSFNAYTGLTPNRFNDAGSSRLGRGSNLSNTAVATRGPSVLDAAPQGIAGLAPQDVQFQEYASRTPRRAPQECPSHLERPTDAKRGPHDWKKVVDELENGGGQWARDRSVCSYTQSYLSAARAFVEWASQQPDVMLRA